MHNRHTSNAPNCRKYVRFGLPGFSQELNLSEWKMSGLNFVSG